MSGSLSPPPKPQHNLRRVAIVFAGGPAPAANAVISTAATSFLRNDISVVGIRRGYSRLVNYTPDRPLVVDQDYLEIDHQLLSRTRNSQGILIGTARTNPGALVDHPSHLDKPDLVSPLVRVYEGLRSLGVDALISIGGDDTLKTANKLKLFQDRMPPDALRMPIVHLPKTIDNDYYGIDFTFGFFTAVDTLGEEIRNLIYDAQASGAYFLTELMGRSAGWLAYGAAIVGEASLVISVEDLTGRYRLEESTTDPQTGQVETRPIMDIDRVVDRIVRTMLARDAEGKDYGVIVIAEGLAEYLPANYLEGVPRDEHGHISITHVNLKKIIANKVQEAYFTRTGRKRKVTGLQLGYESRCAKPQAFDVMLGSQLGVGAYRALTEQKLNGVMVTVSGQLEIHYEKFEDLVDQETLVTKVRCIPQDSDFHRLARFLETYVND